MSTRWIAYERRISNMVIKFRVLVCGRGLRKSAIEVPENEHRSRRQTDIWECCNILQPYVHESFLIYFQEEYNSTIPRGFIRSHIGSRVCAPSLWRSAAMMMGLLTILLCSAFQAHAALLSTRSKVSFLVRRKHEFGVRRKQEIRSSVKINFQIC